MAYSKKPAILTVNRRPCNVRQLALALFVTWVSANDAHNTTAADHLAITAQRLD